jgi:hypothetical protein
MDKTTRFRQRPRCFCGDSGHVQMFGADRLGPRFRLNLVSPSFVLQVWRWRYPGRNYAGPCMALGAIVIVPSLPMPKPSPPAPEWPQSRSRVPPKSR